MRRKQVGIFTAVSFVLGTPHFVRTSGGTKTLLFPDLMWTIWIAELARHLRLRWISHLCSQEPPPFIVFPLPSCRGFCLAACQPLFSFQFKRKVDLLYFPPLRPSREPRGSSIDSDQIPLNFSCSLSVLRRSFQKSPFFENTHCTLLIQ